MRWTCEQLLRHPIFENFLFTVPQTNHEQYEKSRRAQVSVNTKVIGHTVLLQNLVGLGQLIFRNGMK